jgi:photosystem II stability/assembly factor-like uncharacterized protein
LEAKMRGVMRTLVSNMFLVVLAVTPALAEDASPNDDPNGPRWNDTCSLSVHGTTVRWAVGDSGNVLKRVDGDTTAEYVVGRGQYDLCSVSFADENHGWIVGQKRDDPERGRGVIFRTTTSGDSSRAWTATFPVIRPDAGVPFLKVEALDLRHVWVTCADGYMLYTNDGGANWLVARCDRACAEGSRHEK